MALERSDPWITGDFRSHSGTHPISGAVGDLVTWNEFVRPEYCSQGPSVHTEIAGEILSALVDVAFQALHSRGV
jgi:hypothetical protein